MSNEYRVTVNIVPQPQPFGQVVIDFALSTFRNTVDEHCIVGRSSWTLHGSGNESAVLTLTVTYVAAGDNEALQIVEDAAKATGHPYDSVRVVRKAGSGWTATRRTDV